MKRSRSESLNHHKKFKPPEDNCIKLEECLPKTAIGTINTISSSNQQSLNFKYAVDILIESEKWTSDEQISILQNNDLWSPD